MIEIDPTRFRKPKPFAHQLAGVRALVRNPAFYLADKPRTCKSRQVVDAACVLADAGAIDLVLVISPVAARAVWGDKSLGQIKLYSWKRVRVCQFHAKSSELWSDENPELTWVVTNYDFVRNSERLAQLIERLERYRSIILVCDESAALGNYKSDQSKAIEKIRWLSRCPYPDCGSTKIKISWHDKARKRTFECQVCGHVFYDRTAKFIVTRCIMLNGSDELPPNVWSQFNILDNVLSRRYSTFTTFKWQYMEYGPPHTIQKKVVMKGGGEKVVWQKKVCDELGWKNIDKLSKITAPYVLRRTRADCPELRDIPVMFDVAEVALSPATWKMYKQLRREAIIELEKEVYVSPNAGVRLMRLAQMTSGHLGGFEEGEKIREFSAEKLEWVADQLENVSTASCSIVWCRWTRERERLAAMMRDHDFNVYQLHGGQKKDERRLAEMVFANGGVNLYKEDGRRNVMLAQPQAGGIALDMSAASEVYRLSNDYSIKTLEQSNDRPLGPAQPAKTVVYTDILATGPKGERTIDHTIVTALREKKDLAKMTVSEWKKELMEEDGEVEANAE